MSRAQTDEVLAKHKSGDIVSWLPGRGSVGKYDSMQNFASGGMQVSCLAA